MTEEYVETTTIHDEADEGPLSTIAEEQIIETSVTQREELVYEKTKPQLVLTSKFLYARDMIKNLERISSTLESPLIDVDEKMINKCKECQLTFLSAEELKLHVKDHDVKVCKICHTTVKSKADYENHMRENHEKTFICSNCGNLYYDKISLNSHLRSHNEKTKYKCNHGNCEKTFKHHHHLKNHQRVHEKSSPFQCNECTAVFRQRYALTLHKKKHLKQFLECSTCKSQFLRKSQLEKHATKCNGKFKAYKTRKLKQSKAVTVG